MEIAGVCPACSELSRSIKKFEKQLNEERRWNVSQREYCMQLQQEMQKDKDLWQRQENKLRETLKDLTNKIEDLYKIIQDQHKEKVHLEYKNEVLEDNKQELQDKVKMLQDKVRHLCAEMSTAQYKTRMLEEKLIATNKLLEESHKLKARISQAESQKSRLEMKANRLQEEKIQIEAELNNVRSENCQMQMQLIELQQNLSCLDAATQQLQVNHAPQEKPDSLSDIGYLRDSNWGCRENDNSTDDSADVDDLQVLTKETEDKNRNTVTFQDNCILKLQQQTAFHKDDVDTIHKANEMHALPLTKVADSATECCVPNTNLTNDYMEENGVEKSGTISKDNQNTAMLEKNKTVYDICELDSNNACSLCGNEIQINNYKEDIKNIQKPFDITAISENRVNLRENIIISSTEYTLKYGDKTDTVDNFNTIDLKEAVLCENTPCMCSGKNVFINSYSTEPESFLASDSELKWNTLLANSHEQLEDIRKETEHTAYNEENEIGMGTLHSRALVCGCSISELECNEISEETEENTDKYLKSEKESKNMQHSTEIVSNESENIEMVSNSNRNVDPAETKEGNCTNNGSTDKKCLFQSGKNTPTKKEGIISETITSRSEGSQIDSPDSVKSVEKKAVREGKTNKNKGSISLFGKKTDIKTGNRLMSKKNKTQYNKPNQTEEEPILNEVSENSCLDSAGSSQKSSARSNGNSPTSEKSLPRSSPKNNEYSSDLQKKSQRSSFRNNEGSSTSEKSSQRVSPRSNGLIKNREKLSDLSKKYKVMKNTQQYEENNHSDITNEHLNNNNANKTNMHICGKNIQTDNEILNDSATLQCETSKVGHLNSEETLGTVCKGACSSNKIRKKLNDSSTNNHNVDNNVTKKSTVGKECSKRIQTENGIQHIFLNKTTITIDDGSLQQQNTVQCNKDVIKYIALNKNKLTNDKMVYKKTTSPHNRNIHSDIGISSSALNNNATTNNNEADVNLMDKRNKPKYDKNIQTQNGVESIALSKNKNTINDNTVDRRSIPQCNRDVQSEVAVALSESTDGKLKCKKNVLECNKEVQTENGIQRSTSYKNNNNNNNDNNHLLHRTEQGVNETPSIMLCKRNNSVDDDLVQKTNTSQNNKIIQTVNGVQSLASIKSYIIDMAHKNDQDTQIENTIQSNDLSKNSNISGDKLENKINSLSCNKAIQNGISSKHSNTNDDNTEIKNMSEAEKYICNQNENHFSSFTNKSDSTGDKIAYKMNTSRQLVTSSDKNNIVSNNLGHKKNVSQNKENNKNESEVLSSALNKNSTIRDDDDNDNEHRKQTTQWNKDVQSNQGIHPIALNKSAIDNYFAYKRSTTKCEKCAKTKDRIQHITAYNDNGSTANKDLVNKSNIPKSSVCQNQQEIKIITLNDIECRKQTVQCTTDCMSENESHPSELELKVLHEADNARMMNSSTSSSEMCNDMFDSNIKAKKTLTQLNSLTPSEEMSLVSAVKEGKFSNVEELLSQGISPNCVWNGNTALHAAARTGNVCMCRLLLEAGARTDARDSFSSTPLHAAAKCGNLEVTKLLVNWGASIELRDKAGNLPSDIAVINGHIHVYNWLRQQE